MARVLAWFAIAAAFSSVPPFFKYTVTLAGFRVIAFVGYVLKHAGLLVKNAQRPLVIRRRNFAGLPEIFILPGQA